MRKNYLLRLLLLMLVLFVLSCDSSKEKDTYILSSESGNKALASDFGVYNNPSVSKFTLKFDAAEAGTGLIIVYTTDGQLISREKVTVKAGSNTWDYDLPLRAHGIYWVNFTTGNIERTGKIVKSSYRE